MGASQAPDAGAVPVWRSKFYIMIRITNQEEFEKCLPMLDSPDVECRLLGWTLLRECTNLCEDAVLVWSYYEQRRLNLKHLLSSFNTFSIPRGHKPTEYVSYSFLISNFAKKSKIYFGKDYITLKNERTSQ